MYYPGIDFQTSISIGTIYSIHYYEYRTDFTFSGETHDFWEFVYADKGETIITSDQTEFRLKAGELYFHKPNEFHSVRSDGQIAPNLIVISFDLSVSNKSDLQLSSEKQLFALSDRILRIDQTENAQSIGLDKKPASYKLKNTEEILDLITNYLKKHIHEQITLEQICHDNLIGRTQLQKLMKEQFNTGAINYFHQLKIETAKQQIRSGRLNFTQISAGLGYQSVQYFSRQFKNLTGMTPTEYSSSIKALAENSFPE